jgi:hypothetical protein
VSHVLGSVPPGAGRGTRESGASGEWLWNGDGDVASPFPAGHAGIGRLTGGRGFCDTVGFAEARQQ